MHITLRMNFKDCPNDKKRMLQQHKCGIHAKQALVIFIITTNSKFCQKLFKL